MASHPLFPNVRRSPYFAATVAAGASAFMVYNHMYMPIEYGRDARVEYNALTTGVTLWDVAAERQTALRGPDAVRLADYLATRDLSRLAPGQCRYTVICDGNGRIMTEPIVLRPFADTVWISHGDVDLALWADRVAAHGGFDVDVSEPTVSPMQVQGPRSLDVLAALCPSAADLAFYRCEPVMIADAACVLSRTGWSGEHGYEVYPLSDTAAPGVWDAVVEAGAPHDLMITGPNLSRALERGITDTHYFVNADMDPYEAGRGRLVDLDHGPFIGQEALAAAHAVRPTRITVGLVCEVGVSLPPLDAFWPVDNARGQQIGLVRWAAYAFALERAAAIALVPDSCQPGETVQIRHSGGVAMATVTSLPLSD